jgi:hypothetical protein
MAVSFKLTSKSINDKRLLANVHDFVADCIDDEDEWSRGEYPEGLVAFVEEYLSQLMDEQVIEQFKVICDDRNNVILDVHHGVYTFCVQYKQRNCLNITELSYRVIVPD